MKTEVVNLTKSKNLTVFKDLKIGVVCSKNEDKVIIRMARFCKMYIGFSIFVSYVLPQKIREHKRNG